MSSASDSLVKSKSGRIVSQPSWNKVCTPLHLWHCPIMAAWGSLATLFLVLYSVCLVLSSWLTLDWNPPLPESVLSWFAAASLGSPQHLSKALIPLIITGHVSNTHSWFKQRRIPPGISLVSYRFREKENRLQLIYQEKKKPYSERTCQWSSFSHN